MINAPANFLKYNLYAGSNWDILTTSDGLPSNNIFSIKVSASGGQLYLGTAQGVVVYDFQNFTAIQSGLQTKSVRYLFLRDNQLYASEKRAVFRLENDHFVNVGRVFYADITDLFVDSNNEIWVGIQKRGLKNLTTGSRVRFDGPLDNYIGEVHIDKQRRVWMTSGLPKDERKQGIFVMTPAGFVNYYFSGGNNGLYRTLNSSLAVYEDTGGNIWVGSWGGGVIVFDSEMKSFTPINTLTEPGNVWISSVTRDDTLEMVTPPELQNIFSPVPENPLYTAITDIIADPVDRSIWFLDTKPASGNGIIHYRGTAFGTEVFESSSWEHYPTPNEENWLEMSWDIFGDLWLVLEKRGLYQVRIENGTVQTKQYTESDNLKSNAALSVAGDLDGYVWVGTQSGLSAVLSGTVFDFRETYQPIGLRINDIFVDSRNNKWFATDKGLSVLKATGAPFDPQSWVDLIPQNSSLDPDVIAIRSNVFRANLPSEKIHSVLLDESTGDLYLGTDAGLAIVRNNPFASTFENFDRMKVGPNPFIIEDGQANMLNFYNLMPGSEVRILTINGQLVRVLSPENFNEVRGSQAQWDGTNTEGRMVATGVYVYLVSTGEGQQKAGKIMVVRK